MSKDRSFMAVKDAINGESFFGRVNVGVSRDGRMVIYEDVYVRVSYNIGYMQMDVDIMWDDDPSQPAYQSLGLHVGYNTNFQTFSFSGGYLCWDDGENSISVKFPA